jgi:hypothetical protein
VGSGNDDRRLGRDDMYRRPFVPGAPPHDPARHDRAHDGDRRDGRREPLHEARYEMRPEVRHDGHHDPDDAVRPYFVTGGRTRAAVDLQFETIVVATTRGKSVARRLGFERAEILGVADTPLSIAEVSATLKIPLTVTLVLVGDLVAAGHLNMSQSTLAPADDIALIKRLIHGVRSL